MLEWSRVSYFPKPFEHGPKVSDPLTYLDSGSNSLVAALHEVGFEFVDHL